MDDNDMKPPISRKRIKEFKQLTLCSYVSRSTPKLFAVAFG